jgi:hypothetical protein
LINISSGQVRALADLRRKDLVQRLAAFVQAHCQEPFRPGETLVPADATELRAAIAGQVRRAEDWGFDDEQSVAAYVALAFTLNPQFDQHPSIRPILANTVLTAAGRIQHVYRHLDRAEMRYRDEKLAPAGAAR